MNRHATPHIPVLTAIVFAAIVCFSHIHQGTLAVDAIRYATIANEITIGGNWFSFIDPYYGTPYVAKPPLLFWITALDFECFGFSTFNAKFPAVAFTFLALVTIWVIARKESELAALWALVLVVLNRSFTRDLVDLGFDGMAFLGGALAFAIALRLVDGKGRLSWKYGLLGALALLCLLQSKPPYVALVIAPTLMVLLLQRRLGDLIREPVFVAVTLLGAIPTLLWFSHVEPATLAKVGERQLTTFFVLHGGVWKNLAAWMQALFVSMAPLSWISLLAVAVATLRLWRNGWRSEPAVLLSVLWYYQFIPIILFIAVRPRYLWIPLLPGIFLGATLLARRFPGITQVKLQRALLAAAALLLVVVFILGKGLHRSNPYITTLRSLSPAIAQAPLALCSSDADPEERQRALQHAQLLAKLEFGHLVRTGLPNELAGFSGTILGDAGCRDALGANVHPIK